jgi:FkbM family methyltransferase
MTAIYSAGVVTAAAGDQTGTLEFNEGPNGRVAGYGPAWGRTRVPAVTVDGLAREFGDPDVIFVDVEGWEEHVLRGAQATMEFGPDWFVEVHAGGALEDSGSSIDRILSFFRDGA